MLKERPFRRVVLVTIVVAAAWAALATADHLGVRLTDRGGRVLATPQVSAIYLGDYWLTGQGVSDQGRIDSFLQTWLTGPAITGVLAQYRVTSASFATSEILRGTVTSPFSDLDAQAVIQQELAANRIVGGPEAVHVIYLPPGVPLAFAGNSALQNSGYHSSYVDALTNQRVYYAVVVFSQGSNGLDFATGDPVDNITIVSSRLLAGAFTNPDAGVGIAGWLDDALGEVGDIALTLPGGTLADAFARQNGVAVAQLWSNKDDKLDPGTAPTAATSTVLSVTPASQTAAPGTSVTYSVTNAATSTDTLTLSVGQLPANVTAAFTDTAIAPGASTTLTVTVDAAATAGTSTFTVDGAGAASTLSDSVPVTLTIGTPDQVAAAQADFSMSVTPTSQEMIRRGPAVIYTITTAQLGDAGSTTIKLKALHVRSGLQVRLSKIRIAAGETVTLTIRAHRDARRKTYELELKGSSDRADVRIPLTLVLR